MIELYHNNGNQAFTPIYTMLLEWKLGDYLLNNNLVVTSNLIYS